MAADTWPNFPGVDGSPEVESLTRTSIFETEAGTEWSLDLWPAAKKRFTFSYAGLSSVDAAPSPYEAYTEVGAARHLFETLKGRAGRINVVDPDTGIAVECRFEDDAFPLQQDEGAPWWRGSISFITV